jgi:alpha-mannosidase
MCNTVVELLSRRANDINGSLPLTWRYPKNTSRRPLEQRPRASWPVFGAAYPWKKNAPNWFYSDQVFPRSKSGVNLEGGTALCFVRGWMPFTLWVDGKQIWKEEGQWRATGPIADPFPFEIQPGRKHRLVICIKPTDLPQNTFSPYLDVQIKPSACIDLWVELSAAAVQLRLAAELSVSERDRRLVQEAAACVDVRALKANQWARALASISEMERVLEPFSERARKLVVHLIGHAHIDMYWMWTWRDTVNCIRRDFKAVADMMDDYPDLTFTASQVPAYDVVRRMDPSVFRRIKRRIAEGRWENVAGTWVEGDLNLTDGEAVVRQMLYAARWTQEHLGSQAKVFWAPDAFGHPGNMPQLVELGGFHSYFHMRSNPDERDTWPVREWTGIDGTSVPAFSCVYNGSLGPQETVHSAIHCLRHGTRNALHMWGIGDHGGALSRLEIGFLEQYRNKPVMPTFMFSTMKRLLESIRKERPKLRKNRGETYSTFEGCFTTHALIKKQNRQCEGALVTAEALTAMAGLDCADSLKAAWEPALFNQFHDILAGSSTHDAYLDAGKRAARSLKVAGTLTRDAVRTLVGHTGKGKHVAVLNPLGFEFTGPVRAVLPENTACLVDSSGRVVPVQRLGGEYVFVAEKVPAFSCMTYGLRAKMPGADAEGVSVTKDGSCFTVETESAVTKINRRSGVIGSYFDKRLEREFVEYGLPIEMTSAGTIRAELAFNVFQVIDESPNGMSAWLINDVMREENLLNAVVVTLVEAGPVFARFRVKHPVRSSLIEEDIFFYRDFPRIDFEVRVEWREKGSPTAGVPQLKLGFTSRVGRAKARSEGPFVVREVPVDGMERPTQRWVDISGDECGFTLFNDCKYGYDALGGRLRMTLLRNAYGPDPDTDSGKHSFRFGFEAHDGKVSNAELVKSGMAFNRGPLAARTKKSVAGYGPGLVIKGAGSVVCTSLGRAELSDGLIFRFFETCGRRCRARIEFGEVIRLAREVDFLEEPVSRRLKVSGGGVSVGFRPFEVKTLRVS